MRLNSLTSRTAMASAAAAMLLPASVVALPGATAEAATSDTTCGTAAITAVRTADAKLMRYAEASPLSPGGFKTTEVGVGWGSARILAADSTNGDLYGVFTDGSMRVYRFDPEKGHYLQGSQIGTGWGGIKQLIPQGDGVLYAINTAGEMFLYRYDADNARWSITAEKIGAGWGKFSHVGSGGKGVVYGIEAGTGKLHWYKRANFAQTTGSWSGPEVVGTGWGNVTSLNGAGEGILYATMADGSLRWYNHVGAASGTADWKASQVIGNGWTNVRAVTVAPTACTNAPKPPASTLNNPYAASWGANGGWTPRAAWLRDKIKATFDSNCTTYASSSGDHATGNAMDCWGSRETMRKIADWSAANGAQLEVQYVIFEQRIYGVGYREYWRLMEDRGSVTQNHFDHVHISMQTPDTERR